MGTDRERWITYRDGDTYDEVVKAGRLYPLNSLMLHGLVCAKQAPHLSTDPAGDFANEVHSYFGSGTQLQEMYITPHHLLTAADWNTLAEAAEVVAGECLRVLVDTHWMGGDPRWLEVYGWAAWSPKRESDPDFAESERPRAGFCGGYCFGIFELPAGAPQSYSARSPWAAGASRRRRLSCGRVRRIAFIWRRFRC